jgi:PPOX class probable FMN-dependent enzyme
MIPDEQIALVLDPAHLLTTEEQLRAHYPALSRLARIKVKSLLTHYARDFLRRSPFVCLSSANARGETDVSPRGDAPGFVQVWNDETLLMPDWPGNNRLDTLCNLLDNPRVGLVCLIPGMDETLRINGRAQLSTQPALLERFRTGDKLPRSVMIISVEELFLHCGKALKRSRLWFDDHRIKREEIPSLGKLLAEPGNSEGLTVAEAEAAVQESYDHHLY